jgi:hypothetical protein
MFSQICYASFVTNEFILYICINTMLMLLMALFNSIIHRIDFLPYFRKEEHYSIHVLMTHETCYFLLTSMEISN